MWRRIFLVTTENVNHASKFMWGGAKSVSNVKYSFKVQRSIRRCREFSKPPCCWKQSVSAIFAVFFIYSTLLPHKTVKLYFAFEMDFIYHPVE